MWDEASKAQGKLKQNNAKKIKRYAVTQDEHGRIKIEQCVLYNVTIYIALQIMK